MLSVKLVVLTDGVSGLYGPPTELLRLTVYVAASVTALHETVTVALPGATVGAEGVAGGASGRAAALAGESVLPPALVAVTM